MVRDRNKTHVTFCQSYGMWFERFIISTHKYMGDGVYQDKAITLVMVHKIMEGFKIKFHDRISDGEKENPL